MQMFQWMKWVTVCVALYAGSVGCKKGETDAPKPAAGNPGKAKPVIGVSLLTLSNPFFKDIADALKAEGEKRGYEVVITSGEMDPAKQQDQVKDFLARKVTAIVLTPCNSRSIGTAIADANTAGVPVFTADVACTADSVKVASHCATDNLEGGRVAGRAMVEALHGTGKVAVLDHPEVESGAMREKGFLEIVGQSPGIAVVVKLPTSGARDRAFKATEDILQSHPDVDAIFCVNDPVALGSLAALEKANKMAGIKVIGFDGQLEARKAVAAGKLYATVMQYPKQIATVTVEDIAKYLAAEDVPAVKLLNPTIYLKADADKDAELK